MVWIDLAHNRDRWFYLVSTITNLIVSWEVSASQEWLRSMKLVNSVFVYNWSKTKLRHLKLAYTLWCQLNNNKKRRFSFTALKRNSSNCEADLLVLLLSWDFCHCCCVGSCHGNIQFAPFKRFHSEALFIQKELDGFMRYYWTQNTLQSLLQGSILLGEARQMFPPAKAVRVPELSPFPYSQT